MRAYESFLLEWLLFGDFKFCTFRGETDERGCRLRFRRLSFYANTLSSYNLSLEVDLLFYG